MRRLALIALLAAACSNANLPPMSAPIEPAAAATSASPSRVPSPTPTPKPTTKPKPTLTPARLTFGTLNYTASGCWSSDYVDSEGHSISGVVVAFKVSAKNTGQMKSDLIPIRIESTDWFDTTPLLYKTTSWKVSTFRGGDNSIDIDGPAVLPGKSRVISWSVLFQSPFDVHYTVDIGVGHWEVWTSSKVCF